MILTTLYLAAAVDSSTDPWHVLGNSYAERLAIAALADLTLARRLQVAPPLESESPAARRLAVVPNQPLDGALGAAYDLLAAGSRLDVDRAVRLLRDLAPVIEAELVSTGHLVEAGQKGLFKKRPVLTVAPAAGAEAQARIRAGAGSTAPEPRALFMIAITGLATKRVARLCGATPTAQYDPFDSFDPSAVAPDGQPLGDNGADLLCTLITVLAGTSDTTNDFD